MIEIKYPPFIDNAAILLGKVRDIYNAEMNEDAAQYKRGGRSEFVNVLGVKGELIAQYYAFSRNADYKAAKILSNKPVHEPDIVIGKKKFDVKTIRSDAPDLLVNVEAHKKEKGITDYWFVQCIGSNTARFWFYSYDDVSSWEQKDCKYSMAYAKSIFEA